MPLLAALIVTTTAALLLAMGRPAICTCGTVALWVPGKDSPQLSQMIADWYSLSHVAHGLIFFAALAWLAPRWSRCARLTLALAVEAGWELLENSPIIIERYRAATVAVGYTGDSVLNSLSDIAMMALGFALAARLPWRASLALLLVMELAALVAIRDNLTLNVWMLLAPNDAIRAWQAGGTIH